MNPFRTLDDVVLPRLGRGLARCLDAITGGRRRGPRRRRILAGVAVLLVVVAAGAAYSARRRPAPVDTTTGDVVRVGVADGQQVSGYVAQSRAELMDLSSRRTDETYALVALDAYAEPSLLPPLLAGVRTELAYARVPLPGVQTEIVSLPVNDLAADVATGFRRTAARKEAAAKDAEWSATKLGGADQRERALRAYYADTARVDRAEATAYRRSCACVYGVVVRATPLRLRQLAGRPGIRAVDPAPEVRRLDRAVFLPLQPDQLTVVSPPVDSGAPAPPGR